MLLVRVIKFYGLVLLGLSDTTTSGAHILINPVPGPVARNEAELRLPDTGISLQQNVQRSYPSISNPH